MGCHQHAIYRFMKYFINAFRNEELKERRVVKMCSILQSGLTLTENPLHCSPSDFFVSGTFPRKSLWNDLPLPSQDLPDSGCWHLCVSCIATRFLLAVVCMREPKAKIRSITFTLCSQSLNFYPSL